MTFPFLRRAVPRAAACAGGLLFGSAILGACSSKHASDPGGGEVLDASYEASAPIGKCGAIEQERPIEGFTHVDVCSAVTYLTKPPSSGNHYPIWAAYKTYTAPIPEGFFVHNLEHGAIVLTYNCPNGCDADVTAAQAMLDALPADPDCASQGTSVRRRSVMTPDPKLDVQFAASAWGWTLRASCFDADVFKAFALAHYAQGRENICADGQDVSTGLQAGCGQ